MTGSSVSVPLTTLQTKFEVIPPEDEGVDKFEVKATLFRQTFPNELAKIC